MDHIASRFAARHCMAILQEFLLRLAFGLAVGMGLTTWRLVSGGFFRNHLYVTL
jgi:hypothetical protein